MTDADLEALTTPQEETPPAFPLVSGRQRGYHRAAVDSFLDSARAAFEESRADFGADDVRAASFPLVKHGYSIADVDAALARVEDAFAQRAREKAIRQVGPDAWVARARDEAQQVLDHLSRPSRQRFARTSILTFGYRIDEVDHVADRIAAFLRDGDALDVEQIRGAAFRMQRCGYREEQVDALLDATVEVILAVR
ncbi:DivIVA domain-containing protein [Microbacterium esteraromaticum]|uniref:DivIVA domain-containing protein n=1 Tax=Microbacterium esteraromaticum TaxID=57043 RepID=A0A7D8AKZ5_9MICO|nr:DivIVA domain-containing protein [Microbacterium esteraromaticum]QMU98089.1 DivIVA domain-containing protein [Microbacterium esteraromaticum]